MYRARCKADGVDYALKVIQPTCRPDRIVNELQQLQSVRHVCGDLLAVYMFVCVVLVTGVRSSFSIPPARYVVGECVTA